MGFQVPHRGPLAIAHREVEVAIAVEGHPPTPLGAPVAAVAEGVGVEDLLHVVEPVAFEAPPGHGDVAQGVGAGPGVAQVEEAVLGEVGVEDHVPHPRLLPTVHALRAVAQEEDVGEAPYRLVQEDAVADDPETTGSLGDEHVPLRREGHGEGVDQAVHVLHDAEVVEGRLDDAGVGACVAGEVGALPLRSGGARRDDEERSDEEGQGTHGAFG